MINCWSLATQIVIRDYRIRFRRTFLSLLWFLLPLISLAGLALVAGRNLGLYGQGDQGEYLVGLLGGLICWQLFADAWLEPMRFGRRAGSVLRTVSFDQRALLLAGAVSGLIGMMIKLPVLITAMAWFEVYPSFSLAYLPIGLLALVFSGTSLASLTLPTSLVVMDIRYGMPFVHYALLFATPIFYEQPAVGLVSKMNELNVLTHLILPVRDLMTGRSADLFKILMAITISAVVLLVSLVYFRAKVRLATAYIGR